MTNNLPGIYSESYKNFDCYLRTRDHKIKICIIQNGQMDFSDILVVLDKYKNNTIDIENIYSRDVLNFICGLLSNTKYKGNIILRIFGTNREYTMDDLSNGKYINFDILPKQVKINGFPINNEQTEFTAWAHNLDQRNKDLLKEHLVEDNVKRFIDQERVMYSLYKDIIKMYPNIKTFDETARFELIFNYVKNTFPYNASCLQSDGHLRLDCRWASDPVETYRRGSGVCSGRSNLIALVANSPYLNVNCSIVNGYTDGGLPHAWNALVDKGHVYHYDSTFPHQVNRTPTNRLRNRTITGYYSCIKDNIVNSKTPELPPKRKTLRPTPPELPPRRID